MEELGRKYNPTLWKTMGSAFFSDFTNTTHHDIYPAIDPARPELSQAGKTVLITGGSTGIGFAIAQAFIKASATTVIIVARRVNFVTEACAALNEEAKQTGKPATVIGQVCDVTDPKSVDSMWNNFKDKGTTIDILVLNAAKFTDLKSILDLGADEVWSQFEANVKGPIYMTDRFYNHNKNKPKSLVNVTSSTPHMCQNEYHPASAVRPAYALTKASGNLFVQLVAKDISPDEMQTVSFHPGTIYVPGYEAVGIGKDMLPFDNTLPGAYAVWAASKEARFLHGRYTMAYWDVDELASTDEIRKRIDGDVEFLRWGIHGLRGANRDKGW